MNAGDAYEQVMKVTIEGAEITLKLLGKGAEKMAMWIAALLAQNENKPSIGKTNLIKMLKEGQPLKVASLQKEDLQQFAVLAKSYGIPFTPVANTERPNGMLDVLVRQGDADKIDLIFEKLALHHMQEPEKNEIGAPPENSLTGPDDKRSESPGSEKPQSQATGESAEMPRIELDARPVPHALPEPEAERMAEPAADKKISVFIFDSHSQQMLPFTKEMLLRFQEKQGQAKAISVPFEVKERPSVKDKLDKAKEEIRRRTGKKPQRNKKRNKGKSSKTNAGR